MTTEASVSRCRIIFLMPQKTRAARVKELIREGEAKEIPSLSLFDEENNNGDLCQDLTVEIEFLPAVAVFGSYKDEAGNRIRYLASVDFYGEEGTMDKTESLLPYFDEGVIEGDEAKEEDSQEPHISAEIIKDPTKLFYGISGVALGPGLHEPEDVAKIGAFLQTISNTTKALPMEVIQPNKDYSSMKEEIRAFKEMSEGEREVVTRLRSLGPGKMAKFTIDFAVRLVKERLQRLRDALEDRRIQKMEAMAQENAAKTIVEEGDDEAPELEHFIDPTKARYSCKKCRTVLFGEDDFEDPPHSQARHNFSARKLNHGGSRTTGASSICQSYFLKEGVPNLGDMSDIEGRIECPKCMSKVGAWHWSGAQCSCGTWVVPAIQIPKSKVDEMAPSHSANNLPQGTVISPFARLAQAQNLPIVRPQQIP